MKVKHILIVVLIIGITACAIIFGLYSGNSVEGPELLHTFNGSLSNRLKEPAFAIADKNGRIVVADSGNHRVALLNNKGKFLSEIGGQKSEKPLRYPYGLGLIGNDRLLIADIGAGALLEYSVKGKFIKSWYSGGNFKPAGVFVTPDMKVYVSDLGGKRILIFTDQGELLKSIKPRDVALNSPQGIWVNQDDSVWVVDSGNYNVKLLDKNGELANLFDGGPDWPLSAAKGLAVDSKGKIYVSDTLSNEIRVFDSKGNSIGNLGLKDGGDSQFMFPVGLFIDREDKLYVANQAKNQLQVWSLK